MPDTLVRLRTVLIRLVRRTPARPAAANTEPALNAADRAWLSAHQDQIRPTGSATTMVHADLDVQQWMASTLTDLGWDVVEPVMLATGWVPARAHVNADAAGQPYPTVTTPTKTRAFARASDPATSKTAGAAAASRQSITVTSHQGLLLGAYARQHAMNPRLGLTAAEAVAAAGILTDGSTGAPWHRVSDLRDLGLLTPLLDNTSARVKRRNDDGKGSEADVNVMTALGVRAAAALADLAAHGYTDEPLVFDGYSAPTLFDAEARRLAFVAPSRDVTA